MSFYANVFDPVLVVAQIAAMQCLSYLTLSWFIWLFHELFATPFELAQMFNYQVIEFDTIAGASMIAATLINAVAIGVEMSIVVERAKKCLDFAATVVFLHLLACWYASGFPVEWEWWAVHAMSLVISSVCGEYLCMKKEMQEINMNEFLSVSRFHYTTNRLLTTTTHTDGSCASTSHILAIKPSAASRHLDSPVQLAHRDGVKLNECIVNSHVYSLSCSFPQKAWMTTWTQRNSSLE